MEKEYTCDIVLSFGRSYMANSKDEFINMVITDFADEYGIKLDESEIKNIEEIES